MCRAYRKEGGMHDPFAELTGLSRAPPKASPPLRNRGAAGSTAAARSSSAAPQPAAAAAALPPAASGTMRADSAASAAAPAQPAFSATSADLGSFAVFPTAAPAANGGAHARLPVQTDFQAGSFETGGGNGSLI